MTNTQHQVALCAAALTGCALILTGGGCAPEVVEPKLTLTVSESELPADGLSPATLTAKLVPGVDGVVVRFSTKLGALTRGAVVLKDGQASTTLYPPFEPEIGSQSNAELQASAEVLLEEGKAPLRASVSYTVVPSQTGDPGVVAAADPQRVLADGETPLVVHISGRRVEPGTTVSLTTDVDVGLPASIDLDDALEATLTVAARTEPVSFTLTVTVPGAAPFSLPLAFLGDDAPVYDLGGVFAQISYGVVQLNGFGVPEQEVSAPTISLVRITQLEDRFDVSFETCDVEMPAVCLDLGILGKSLTTTTPGPGFAEAIPQDTFAVPVRGRALDAIFEPDADTLARPVIVGADLDNPNDTLPDNMDDPRLTDPDGDGSKGVTVFNSMLDGPQYIAYRQRTEALRGVIRSNDIIDGGELGSLQGSNETSILNGDAITSNLSPEVHGRPSNFMMERVDGRYGGFNIAGNDGDANSISCADVRQYLADPSTLLAPPELEPTTCAN